MTERPKSFVYRPRVRKQLGHIGVKDDHDRALGKAACIFAPNAPGKVIFWQHLFSLARRANLVHTFPS
jgi:hypothetical protein